MVQGIYCSVLYLLIVKIVCRFLSVPTGADVDLVLARALFAIDLHSVRYLLLLIFRVT